jgi:3-hydroxyacyl-CoA dehydrogenase
MPELVHYEVRDRVAILTIDNPPLNALGAGVWEGIDSAVARAGADSGVDAIVVQGVPYGPGASLDPCAAPRASRRRGTGAQ